MHSAHDDIPPLKTLEAAATAPLAHRVARSLALMFAVLLVLLAFTPWQQNVRGVGRIVAYAPAERQQIISAQVEGRIAHWRVREGSQVKQGEVLAEITDNDPLFLERISNELQSYLAKQVANDSRVETFRQQLKMAEQARPQALAAAESRIEMAKQRRSVARQTVTAALAARQTASLNLARQQQLQGKGLASKRTLELSQLEMAQRNTEVERSEASLAVAGSEVEAINADRQKLAADTLASIEKARADLQKAIEDQNTVRGEVLKLQTRLARQQT